MKTSILQKTSLGLVVLLGLVFWAEKMQAQTTPTPTQLAIDSLEEANRLDARRQQARAARQVRRTALHRRAAELNIPLKKNGSSLRAIGPDGRPIYDAPDNVVSQQTTSATQVKTNGGLGLNLDGAGITIGLWEAGGIPRASHQEFGGRAQIMEAGTATRHATHVAGTLIGAGVGTNADAQGFSHAGNLVCYDADDDVDEMDDEASDATPIRLSNHSYGPNAGWTFIQSSGMWQWDGGIWQFGAYSDDTEEWDEVAFDNPFFTIFKSAGNHRDDNPGGPLPAGQPADGPYDCITTYSTAKNIVTVGAVDDIAGGYTGPASVQQIGASFSSWGPTDDGRIKPDIVANGVGLKSAVQTADDAYGNSGGTSMATPSAAGGAGLILQHWGNVLGGTPRSATLKGLLISQADEAGAANGPDYQTGWGLMNVADAVQMITFEAYDGCRHYLEGSLDDDEVFTYNVYSSGSNRPLKITLTWTDVPSDDTNNGTTNPAGVRYLVNDLDLRVTRPNGTVAFPWVLDPANPANAATTGDNDRDNVEQILILAPAAGEYTISVRAPADVEDGPQRFTIWMSGNDSDEYDKVVASQVLSGTQTLAARHNLQVGPDVLVTPGANVRALAGHGITLRPNFRAQAGSQFLARIMRGGGCGQFSADLKADNYGAGLLVGEADDRFESGTEVATPTQPALQVQPNPFESALAVRVDLPTDESATLTLRSMTGQVLYTWLRDEPTRAGTYQFDYQGNALPAGMYFVELRTATHRQTTKVVKVR
jgi:hypothetical protein